MRVLAIDTALEACSAAILETQEPAIAVSETQVMVRGHAEALVPLIQTVLERSGVRIYELDRIAVTTGPGSFTGLRVGIAAARGIGIAAGKPVVGVTTLAALAAPYMTGDNHAPIAAAIDARHQHVYLQIFAGGRSLLAPRIVALAEAVRATAAASARLVGSGARMIADSWPHLGGPPLVDERRAPDIDWVARLGAKADAAGAPPKPLYLRAPDAQPQTAAQLPRR